MSGRDENRYAATPTGPDETDRPSSLGGPNPWAQQGGPSQPDEDRLPPTAQHRRFDAPSAPMDRSTAQTAQPTESSPEPGARRESPFGAPTRNQPSVEEDAAPPLPTPSDGPPDVTLTRTQIRRWAAGAHLGGVLAWIPVAPAVPAIAVYAVYRDRIPYLREQTLEAINFQICVFVLWVALTCLDRIAPFLPDLTFLAWLYSTCFAVAAALAALAGRHFRYPFIRRSYRGRS